MQYLADVTELTISGLFGGDCFHVLVFSPCFSDEAEVQQDPRFHTTGLGWRCHTRLISACGALIAAVIHIMAVENSPARLQANY
ncbi:hypothetical protein PsAD14_00935 [Pseudovibrio sp. Ad14]|nr:hypothetical protein PsW74_01914 [Pseudovibrio sp. W74]KZL11184.1 hypothetical protein PsAD14_00935 [Pseudovibrio sp. Ad14]